MNYIETYVRPKYKSFLLYLLVLLCTNMILVAMNYFLCGGLSGDFNLISKGTVFGDTYTWFVMYIATAIITPIVCIPLYGAYVPHKYDKEWKQGLIPYNKETNQPMMYPEKINKIEPVWKQNEKFTAILKFVRIRTYNRYTFAELEDTAGNRFLMFYNRFNKLVEKSDIMHNTYYGTFKFDTNWKIVNIMEV